MSTIRTLLVTLVLIVILFLIITLTGKSVEAPTLSDLTTASSSDVVASSTQPATPPEETKPTTMVVTDVYKNGVHKYSFDAFLPTPCHKLSPGDATIRESFPEQVGLSFAIIPPPAGTICAQSISHVLVSINVPASENAVLSSIRIGDLSLDFTLTRTY